MSDKGNGSNRRTIGLAPRRRCGSITGGDMTGEGAGAMGTTRTQAQAPGWLLRAAAVLVAGGLLVGCSDAWDTVSRPLDPLPPADPQDVDAPQQGAGEYPNLSSVPDAPPRRPSGREERQEIRDTLSADRANARYSDRQQTGEGIETRARTGDNGSADTGSTGTGASATGSGGSQRSSQTTSQRTSQTTSQPSSQTSSQTAPSGAPDRPEVAGRMPADDAGAQQSGSSTAGTSEPASSASQSSKASGQDDGRAAAPDVPQLQQSQQGEPIEVPGQPSFNGGEPSSNGQMGQSSRAQQQQSASRQSDSGARAPDAAVGQSRTLSRQDAGGQTMAGGGRRVAVIYFRHGSASLQGRDRQVLRKVAEIYERQGQDLRVVGHASSRTAGMDPVDHRMANFDTSLKRAQAVVDTLVSMGVPREAIQLEARGDNEPVYHEFMPTGEAGNRRAEVFLQG